MSMDLLKLISPWIDDNGLLTELNGDGGDSAQREGMLLLLAAALERKGLVSTEDYMLLKGTFILIHAKLIRPDGTLRRHCDESKWYGRWDKGSRDQYHLILGAGAAGLKSIVLKVFKGHLRRALLFTTNYTGNGDTERLKLPDITLGGFWAYYLRALLSPVWLTVLYPLMCLLDLSLVFNSLIRVYYFGRDKENTDVLNHLQALIYSELMYSTVVSRFAMRLMRRMPKKFDANGVNGVQQELDNYFGGDQSIKAFAIIWQPVVLLYLEGWAMTQVSKGAEV